MLLRRASDTLLDMARFGIAAELSASPHMTAYEAASLLAACKQLSQQHAVALTLTPPLEDCKHAEACLRGALECIQDARQARESALGRRAAALEASAPALELAEPSTLSHAGDAAGVDASNFMEPQGVPVSPRRFGETLVYGTAPASLSARRQDAAAVQRYPTSGERAAAQTATLLAEHDELLAEEEQLLQRVQQLDDEAARLERQSAEQMHAFRDRWAEVAASPLLSEEASRWLIVASEGDGTYTTASPRPQQRTSRRRLHAVEENARSPGAASPGAGPAYLARPTAPSGREAATFPLSLSSPAAHHLRHDPGTPASSGVERAQLDAETERLQQLTHNMLLRQQDLLREQYQEREQLRARDGAGYSGALASSRVKDSSGDIDADLLAMAAAAVARAKAAAAELAARDRPSARHMDFAALAPPPTSRSPQRVPAAGTAAPASQPDNARQQRHKAEATTRAAVAPQPQHAPPAPAAVPPPGYITDMASLRSSDGNATTYPAPSVTPQIATTVPPAATEADVPKEVPLTARATYPAAAHEEVNAHELALAVGSAPLELTGPPSPPISAAGSLLAPPSSSQGTSSSSRSQRGERPWGAAIPASTPGPAPYLGAYHVEPAPSTAGTSEAGYGAAGQAHAAGQFSAAHALEGVRPETPLLVRLPLPDDLNNIAAEGLRQLWSGAALHYARAQHMHEGAIAQLEQQWERCQAQLQVLQAEEMQVRAAGRIAEAEAVASAAARWRQRAAHLHTAMKRHGVEAARHKSLARRATSMSERLHVLSAAASSTAASTAAGLEAAAALTELRRAGLVPQLPTSVLAASPMVQGLERLQATLTEQIASLHAAAAGLQLQSQRTFAKATSRSRKLQVRRAGLEPWVRDVIDAASHAVTSTCRKRNTCWLPK
mgnify:CR=1 FL=1